MTRHKLISDDSYEFVAIGVSCHLKDFRLAWNLNRMLQFNLMRDTVRLSTSGNHVAEFDVFRHSSDELHLSFIVLNNFSDTHCLIKSHRQFDFFILIQGSIEFFDVDDFISRLQTLDQLQFASIVDSEVFEKIQYALFEN